MSIVLKDGTVLPDLPDGAFSVYQYGFICQDGIIDLDDFSFTPKPNRYVLNLGWLEPFFCPGSLVGAPIGMVMHVDSSNNSFAQLCYDTNDPDSGWVQITDYSAAIYGVDGYVYWSNFDIMTAIGLNDDFTPIIGTEVYFADSTKINPPFILPDGTELPALPDGCFDGTPYGFVKKITVPDSVGTTAYLLYLSANPISFCAGEIIGQGVDFVISVADTLACYGLNADKTEWFIYTGGPHNMWSNGVGMAYVSDFGDAGNYEVAWSNSDMTKVSGVDEETEMPIISTEIWRESDDNYRITGGVMRDFANQARRLGASTASLKPAEIEAIFRAVTA